VAPSEKKKKRMKRSGKVLEGKDKKIAKGSFGTVKAGRERVTQNKAREVEGKSEKKKKK